MSKPLLPILITLLALVSACSRPQPAEVVTHEERALAKARAAWASTYTHRAIETFSPENLQRFAPYSATLETDVWVVRGTVPADFDGEVPEARIRANDGATTVQMVRSSRPHRDTDAAPPAR